MGMVGTRSGNTEVYVFSFISSLLPCLHHGTTGTAQLVCEMRSTKGPWAEKLSLLCSAGWTQKFMSLTFLMLSLLSSPGSSSYLRKLPSPLGTFSRPVKKSPQVRQLGTRYESSLAPCSTLAHRKTITTCWRRTSSETSLGSVHVSHRFSQAHRQKYVLGSMVMKSRWGAMNLGWKLQIPSHFSSISLFQNMGKRFNLNIYALQI